MVIRGVRGGRHQDWIQYLSMEESPAVITFILLLRGRYSDLSFD
jgi:hypothetical protein